MSSRFFPSYPDYIVTSRYGMRTLKGVTKMHNGIDLTATRDGTVGKVDHIMAHTGETVCAVGYDKSAGNYIKYNFNGDISTSTPGTHAQTNIGQGTNIIVPAETSVYYMGFHVGGNDVEMSGTYTDDIFVYHKL